MKYLLTLLVLALFPSNVYTATLLEVDWATGTGNSCSVLQDGVFSVCTDGLGESFTVKAEGYGGRNYLAMFPVSGDMTNHLRASSPSIGGPSTVYIRYWFKKNSDCGAMHPMYISSGTSVDSGFAAFRDWSSSFSIIPYVYQADPHGDLYYYTGTINTGTWYRLEYKVQNAGGSSGTITVRLDGVDITSSMRGYTSGNDLPTYNGSLQMQAINYVNFEIYSGQCVSSDWLDIAGLKITDGPDWIGGDVTASTYIGIISNGVKIR